MDTSSTKSRTHIYKGFYRLDGKPNERLILRALAEKNGAKFTLNDRIPGNVVINCTNQVSMSIIHRKFYNIVNYGRSKLAMAEAVFPEINNKHLRSQWWRHFSDAIISRINGNNVSVNETQTKIQRYAYRAAINCEYV